MWRLLYGDFKSTKEEVVSQMFQEKWTIQPEVENFMLTELTIGLKQLNSCIIFTNALLGSTMYFKKCSEHANVENMEFFVKGIWV